MYTLYMPPCLPGCTSGCTGWYMPPWVGGRVVQGGIYASHPPTTLYHPGYTHPVHPPPPRMPLVEYVLLAASCAASRALGSIRQKDLGRVTSELSGAQKCDDS